MMVVVPSIISKVREDGMKTTNMVFTGEWSVGRHRNCIYSRLWPGLGSIAWPASPATRLWSSAVPLVTNGTQLLPNRKDIRPITARGCAVARFSTKSFCHKKALACQAKFLYLLCFHSVFLAWNSLPDHKTDWLERSPQWKRMQHCRVLGSSSGSSFGWGSPCCL